MNFIIDKKYKITATSTQKVKDVVKQLSEKSKVPPENIQLINDAGVQLRLDSYLYSSFVPEGEGHTYSIQSKRAKRLTFQNQLGKYFTESFIESMKIGDIINELKNRGKKIEEDSFIILNGRVIDNKSTLSSLIPKKKDDDDDDDDDYNIFIIENKIPKQINIKLKFQFGKSKESNDFDIKFIRPALALDVRYWASIISCQNPELLSLEHDGETLNDDDNLEEDAEIIVSSDSLQNDEQDEEDAEIIVSSDSLQNDEQDEEDAEITSNSDDSTEKLIAQYFMYDDKGKKKSNTSDFMQIDEKEEKHHKIIKKIGEGATAIAYKIVDTRTNEIMCKKVLKIVKNPTFKNQSQVMKEIQILYSSHHPCICRGIGYNPCEEVEGFDEDDEVNTIAFFLEYLEYSLKDCLENKLLNDTLKTRIAVEIVHGLLYLHKREIFHRDVKIENVMLNSAFEAKLIDFGLVKTNEELQLTISKGVGTLNYMSPEMINMSDYDYKTDVYSLGILLHFMFVGVFPNQILKDKLNYKKIPLPKPSASISKCCIDLIEKCTDPYPENRPNYIEIINLMKKNSFKLTPNVDSSIVSRRNLELEIISRIQSE